MRTLRNLLVGLLAIIIIVVLAIFAVENITPIRAHFVGNTFSASLWWIAVGSAILGFILGLLVLTPGRLETGWRAHRLRQHRDQLEQQLTSVREQQSQLQVERDRLQAAQSGLTSERDRLRTQLAASAPPPQAPAPHTTTVYSHEPGQTQVMRESVSETTTEQPTLGERVRGFLHTNEQRDERDMPPAPTA